MVGGRSAYSGAKQHPLGAWSQPCPARRMRTSSWARANAAGDAPLGSWRPRSRCCSNPGATGRRQGAPAPSRPPVAPTAPTRPPDPASSSPWPERCWRAASTLCVHMYSEGERFQGGDKLATLEHEIAAWLQQDGLWAEADKT
ncbi:MAG: hypothetical protein MI924_18980 [Chloroflexales bacterium]|nr:hypothetical protein [Chloroflexales bacterium]